MVAVGVPISVGVFFGGATVYYEVAVRVLVKPADYVQQGGLAAAGVTENGDKLALAKLKVNALERMNSIVANGIIFCNAF